MPSSEKRRIDLKRAFREIAAQSAPPAADLEPALARALIPVPERPRPVSRLRPRLLLPVAAAFAFGLGGALLCSRLAPASTLLAEYSDPLLSSANAQAAASVGLSPFNEESASAPDSDGIESDLLSYIETLWTPDDEAAQPKEI